MRLLLEEPGLELWHGDGEAFVRGLDLSDLVVIADLPYGSGRYEGDKRFAPETIEHLLTARTCALFGWPEDLAALIAEQSIRRGEVIRPDEWITWWAPNKPDARAHNLRESEAIAVFGLVPGRDRVRRTRSEACRRLMEAERRTGRERRGRSRISNQPLETARDGDVWPLDAPGVGFNAAHRLHQNEKPLELMRRLVLLCSDPGELVIDPCCGSGTTLVAARELGRPTIGVEAIERHCLTALERGGQQVLPGVSA